MTMTERAEAISKSPWITMLWQLFGVILVPSTGWAITVLLGVQADVRIMQAQFATYAADRYRADEARRDFQLRDLRIDTIEKGSMFRFDSIEQRLSTLEHDIRTTKTTVEEIAPPVRRRQQ